MVLDVSLHNTQHYRVQIKDKWINSGKRFPLSSTPQCSKYLKESLRVALDNVRPTYLVCLERNITFQVLPVVFVNPTVLRSVYTLTFFRWNMHLHEEGYYYSGLFHRSVKQKRYEIRISFGMKLFSILLTFLLSVGDWKVHPNWILCFSFDYLTF